MSNSNKKLIDEIDNRFVGEKSYPIIHTSITIDEWIQLRDAIRLLENENAELKEELRTMAGE